MTPETLALLAQLDQLQAKRIALEQRNRRKRGRVSVLKARNAILRARLTRVGAETARIEAETKRRTP